MNGLLALDVFGSWILPGFGFFRRGRYIRAIILFIIIEGTFFIGLALRGGVVLPIVDFSGGGIISLLTFLIQLGNGLMSFFSLAALAWCKNLMAQGFLPGEPLRFLTGDQPHALFELGAFYLLISGAVNYFAVSNFYDRYKAGGAGSAPVISREGSD